MPNADAGEPVTGAVTAPTLDDIKAWPATVPVPEACAVLGISRSHGYELIRIGEFPFRVLHLRGRYTVVTSSIIAVLSDGEARAA